MRGVRERLTKCGGALTSSVAPTVARTAVERGRRTVPTRKRGCWHGQNTSLRRHRHTHTHLTQRRKRKRREIQILTSTRKQQQKNNQQVLQASETHRHAEVTNTTKGDNRVLPTLSPLAPAQKRTQTGRRTSDPACCDVTSDAHGVLVEDARRKGIKTEKKNEKGKKGVSWQPATP